jgi:hypothetical protein
MVDGNREGIKPEHAVAAYRREARLRLNGNVRQMKMKWDRADWRFPPDMGCLIVMPLTAILAGMILPLLSAARRGDKTLFLLSLGISALGVILLFRARLPLYRQRRFFSFGSAALPEPQRRLYRYAWKVILVGAGMLAILNVMMRI